MPLFRSANNGFSNLIGAPRDPTYLKGSRSDHRTTVIQTCFTHTSCNVWMEAKLTMPAASMTRAERVLTNSLATADIRIGGRRRWDIQVHDPRFFGRVLAAGTLGFGESYMDGWWDCEALDEMCCRAIRARLDERFAFSLPNLWTFLTARFSNRQTQRRAKKVGRVHYDLGNDFFEAMLDPNMQYSCALFGEGDDLPAAQRRKLEWICERLRLRPGLRLLDIGCGWGGLARYASRHYGCKVVGVTISKEQFEYARRWCDGLDVEIQLRDYREVPGEFDRVVSVGMVEHVGPKNYRTYFRVVSRYLTNDGLFLCHGIASNSSSLRLDPWIARYIFPNSQLPSMARLARAAEGLFIIDDIANIGPNYDPTLLAWNRNFERAWPRFADRNGERFRRMWRFYLLGCAGAFRARNLQVFSILFSKEDAESFCEARHGSVTRNIPAGEAGLSKSSAKECAGRSMAKTVKTEK